MSSHFFVLIATNSTIHKQQDHRVPDNYIEEGLAKIISGKSFSFLMPEL
ncbi:MAG: hypothetical protein ABJB05_17145 [Parafilimonas sp.]